MMHGQTKIKFTLRISEGRTKLAHYAK